MSEQSFYTVSGNKTYTTSGNLSHKLQPGSYYMDYCNRSYEPYLTPSVLASTDETIITDQMKEVIGICKSFVNGVKDGSIEEFGYKTKFGLLLKGPPGTGKSQILNTVAHNFVSLGGMVINLKDQQALEDGAAGDYLKHLNNIQPETPILFLLEDLDGIHSSYERSLTSILDGERSPKNILFLGTTNFEDHISNRLLRPGRFDLVYTVKEMSKEIRQQYITNKLKSFNKPTDDSIVNEYMTKTSDLNMAQLRTLMAYVGIFDFTLDNLIEKVARNK